MSTILDIANQGEVIRWELDPTDRRQVERLLFLAPGFRNWMDTALSQEPPDRGRDLNPLEQVVAMFDQFVGDPGFRGVGDFVWLNPQWKGVYELKTTDVRVFGFFPRKGAFVAVSGDMKKHLKGNRASIVHHIDNVVTFRDHLELGEPSFVKGRNHEIL